jgi:hypothetical protein
LAAGKQALFSHIRRRGANRFSGYRRENDIKRPLRAYFNGASARAERQGFFARSSHKKGPSRDNSQNLLRISFRLRIFVRFRGPQRSVRFGT